MIPTKPENIPRSVWERKASLQQEGVQQRTTTPQQTSIAPSQTKQFVRTTSFLKNEPSKAQAIDTRLETITQPQQSTERVLTPQQYSDVLYGQSKQLQAFTGQYQSVASQPNLNPFAQYQLARAAPLYVAISRNALDQQLFQQATKVQTEWHPSTKIYQNTKTGEYRAEFPYAGAEYYGSYKNILETHPELPALRAFHSGTLNVDLALANKQQRTDIMVQYIHELKGSPTGGVDIWRGLSTVGGSPWVQISTSALGGYGIGKATGFITGKLAYAPTALKAFNIGMGTTGIVFGGIASKNIYDVYQNKGLGAALGTGITTAAIFGSGTAGYKAGISSLSRKTGLTLYETQMSKQFPKQLLKNMDITNAQRWAATDASKGYFNIKGEMRLSGFKPSQTEINFGNIQSMQNKPAMQRFAEQFGIRRKTETYGGAAWKDTTHDWDVMVRSPLHEIELGYGSKILKQGDIKDIADIKMIQKPGEIVGAKGTIKEAPVKAGSINEIVKWKTFKGDVGHIGFEPKYNTGEYIELFHGTTKNAAEKILTEGLKQGFQSRGFKNYEEPLVSTTLDIDVAKAYGDTILKIKIPKTEFKKMWIGSNEDSFIAFQDPYSMGTGERNISFSKDIPTKYISKYNPSEKGSIQSKQNVQRWTEQFYRLGESSLELAHPGRAKDIPGTLELLDILYAQRGGVPASMKPTVESYKTSMGELAKNPVVMSKETSMKYYGGTNLKEQWWNLRKGFYEKIYPTRLLDRNVKSMYDKSFVKAKTYELLGDTKMPPSPKVSPFSSSNFVSSFFVYVYPSVSINKSASASLAVPSNIPSFKSFSWGHIPSASSYIPSVPSIIPSPPSSSPPSSSITPSTSSVVSSSYKPPSEYYSRSYYIPKFSFTFDKSGTYGGERKQVGTKYKFRQFKVPSIEKLMRDYV